MVGSNVPTCSSVGRKWAEKVKLQICPENPYWGNYLTSLSGLPGSKLREMPFGRHLPPKIIIGQIRRLHFLSPLAQPVFQ